MENQEEVEEKIEAEYTEDLYAADYKGKKPLPHRRIPIGISAIEEKIDKLSIRKGKRVNDIEKKVDKILSRRSKR